MVALARKRAQALGGLLAWSLALGAVAACSHSSNNNPRSAASIDIPIGTDTSDGSPRAASDIDLIVIHTIGGPICENDEIRYEEISGSAIEWRDWFLEQTDKSIHYIVGRDGDIAAQRPDLRTAGHVSYHGIIPNVNKRSIGIELVNNGDGIDPFSEVQLAATEALVAELARRYGIGADRVRTHAELDTRPIGGCNGHPRRVDPNILFPMERMQAAIRP